MTPVDFPQANVPFCAPAGLAESQVMTIKAYVGTITTGSLDGSVVVVTAWLPTPEELAMLNQGQPLYLSFLGGLPPHFPTVDFHSATHPA